MRIGTWNLNGAWSAEHRRVLNELSCDVWLRTENQPDARPDGYFVHSTSQRMGANKYWAGIASRSRIDSSPDPDVASALGETQGYLFCSSVLPWPLAGSNSPWGGGSHGDQMREAIGRLAPILTEPQVVWGGDWNQPLDGNIQGFTRDGQRVLTTVVDSLGLAVATKHLFASNGTQFSIDHIAVPQRCEVVAAGAVTVAKKVSDHSAYWIEVDAD